MRMEAMAILAGVLFVAFWLGAAFCYVVIEPIARRQAYDAMQRRFALRIRLLEGRVEAANVAEGFRAHYGRGYDTSALPVIDAEGE